MMRWWCVVVRGWYQSIFKFKKGGAVQASTGKLSHINGLFMQNYVCTEYFIRERKRARWDLLFNQTNLNFLNLFPPSLCTPNFLRKLNRSH